MLRLSREVAQSRARGSRRNQVDSVESRAERAQALAQLGARQALEGSCVAPGNLATLRSLTNPSRRPVRPQDPLPDSVVEHRATSTFALDSERFLGNLRCSKSCWRVVRDDLRTLTPLRPSKTPPKFNEKTPRETQKERNGGGRGKKRAKFWAVR